MHEKHTLRVMSKKLQYLSSTVQGRDTDLEVIDILIIKNNCAILR